MPYIDTNVKEGTLLTDLKALITANGWIYEKSFKKVAYPNTLINPQSSLNADSKISLSVAEHMIFSNAQGLYYGIAKIYNFTELKKDLPHDPKVSDVEETAFKQWIADQYQGFGKECAVFFYMSEQIPAIIEGGHFGCAVDVSTQRGAIDIENELSRYVSNGSGGYIFEYHESYPDRQQSPFIKSTLRNPNLADTDVATNWWPDSLVRVKGFIDAEHLFVVMQADNTPAFMNNVVPTVPVYWGKFESFKTGDVGNHALWAGTAFDTGSETQSHTFDQKSSTPYRVTADYLPVGKTYPNFPGNGIDNIIVKRAELGSRYQAYFLSWNTAPQNMPPDRVGKDGGQYPLSWTTQDNDEYKYKFNPSMYSQKIHTSRAYLIHPDEGVRGYLPKMVILSPLGLVNEDKLKVRTGTCPDTFDIYRFFLTSAISPVSKRPGTAYTPAGIGIYEKSI
jgi:hypothetical protein